MSKTSFYDTYHKKNRNKKYSSLISENNFTYFYTLKYLKKALEYIHSQDLKVLDLGCGVGTIDFYLAQKGYSVTGIDISKDAIEICNQVKKDYDFLNTQFIYGDVQTYQFQHKFDLVICSEVIEHVEKDQVLLARIHSLLNENGVLLLTTPSLKAPLYRLGLLKNFDRRVGHLRRYELASLVTMIQNENFEILSTDKTESFFRNALYTFPYLGYLIKFIRGPLVPLYHVFDRFLTTFFGESDLVVIARKI